MEHGSLRPGLMSVGLAFAFIFSGIIILIPSHVQAATKTWNQTSGNLASTDANWIGGVKPVAGDDVVFDGTSTADCTWDLNIALATFSLNSGYSGTVTLNSDFSTTGTITVVAGTLNGNECTISTAGSFSHTTGTITTDKLKLTMTGTAKTLKANNVNFLSLSIQGTITQISYSSTTRGGFEVTSGKTLTISTGLNHAVYLIAAGGTYANAGTIAGTGTAALRIFVGNASINPTLTFGTLTIARTEMYTYNGGSSCTVYPSGDTVFGGLLSISSLDATQTVTFDLTASNYALTTSGITIGQRGILNGRGSAIVVNGNWDSSASGTFTPGTSTVSFSGTGYTLKTAASATFYSMTITGRISCTSSVNVTNNLAVNSGAMVTVGSGKILDFLISSTNSYTNSGSIAGSGTIRYSFVSADKTIAFGTIAANLTWIWAKSTATANRTLTMSGDSLLCGSLLLNSSHASNYMIFDARAGDVIIRNTFTNGTRGMVYYTDWLVQNISLGSYSYGYQVDTAGELYYARNMVTGLIELADVGYADNVTQYAIDNSLTDAEVNLANGTYVFFAGHDFYVGGWNYSVSLNTTSNLTITGSGASILTYREGVTVAVGKGVTIFLVNDQSETFTVRNLTFEPAEVMTATFKAPMFFYHPTGARPGFRNLTIEECYFDNLTWGTWGDGVYYYGVNNRFLNNTFDSSILAFHNTPSQSLVSGNTFIGTWVWIDSMSNITVSNNTFVDSTSYSIFMYDVAQDTVIRDNIMTGDSPSSSIGVFIDRQSGKSDCWSTTIERNAFTDFDRGVFVEGANDTVIRNNSYLTVRFPVVDYANGTVMADQMNFSYGPSFGETVTLAWDGAIFNDGPKVGVATDDPQTWINITLDEHDSLGRWLWSVANPNSNLTYTCTLSGLDHDMAYKLYRNSSQVGIESGPAVTISGVGNASFQVAQWYPHRISDLVVFTVHTIGLGIMVTIVGSLVMPFAKGISNKNKSTLKLDPNYFIRGAVFIVIGLVLYGMVYMLFIGG